MANKTTKAREDALSPPKQTAFKLSSSHLPLPRVSKAQATSSPRRQLRENHNAKNIQKHKGTVSAAGLFKKEKPSRRDKKARRRHRSPTPELEPDLYLDFQDSIEDARAAINDNVKANFNDAHASLQAKLLASIELDKVTMETLTKTSDILKAPLTAEQIETEVRLNGKVSIEVVEIGNRIAIFRETIEKEKAKLADYWKQWDDIQNEYIALGLEVFGPEAFGDISLTRADVNNGYKREMELLEIEDSTKFEGIDEDIEEVGAKALQKMEASEKELDAMAKKEQARLLQALMMQ